MKTSPLLMFFCLVIMSGCISLDGASKKAAFRFVQPIKPASDEVVVNFYHPFGLEDLPVPMTISPLPGPAIPILFSPANVYQLWLDNDLAGFLPVANRCVQIKTTPGKHIFLGRFVRSNAGNWTVLEGTLAAGKTYFVKVTQRWNTWKPSIVFEVVKPTDPDFDTVGSCKTPLAYDRTSGESAQLWDNHVKENVEGIRTVFSDLRKGSTDYYFDTAILPEDGI